MKIPIKISPDPIIDAVTELRFSSALPQDAVFGVIFKEVKEDFEKFEKLPICQIPEEITNKDPNLKYSPHYQAISGDFKLNIGPRVISLANINEYSGWVSGFFPKIQRLIGQLKSSGVVTNFHRLGLRYIDFFNEDIFNSLNLAITYNGDAIQSLEKQFTTLLAKKHGIVVRIQVANNVRINRKDKPQEIGSVIDADVFYEPQNGFGFEDVVGMIDKCHDVANETFFSLLKEEYILSRNPRYENE
ncbi:TIGR04255 family protein [Myxococcota bacterium]|nr:TIGR04255 family protein [Myxococcota bacterium]MBU1379374.1 TIGR04255 family protein [Myxococcota bacterium]